MNYDLATERYVQVKNEIARVEAEHKEKLAPLKEKMTALENWLTAKAIEDGLETIKTNFGTVFWTTLHSASVANRGEFFDFVKEHEQFDMLEARCNKTMVAQYVKDHGAPPPGVNFNSYKNLNFRTAAPKEANTNEQ